VSVPELLLRKFKKNLQGIFAASLHFFKELVFPFGSKFFITFSNGLQRYNFFLYLLRFLKKKFKKFIIVLIINKKKFYKRAKIGRF
jgi:hypothetical protein